MDFKTGDRVTVMDRSGIKHMATVCSDTLTSGGFLGCVRDDGETPNRDGAWYSPPENYELIYRPTSAGCIAPGTVVDTPAEIFSWEAHKAFFKRG